MTLNELRDACHGNAVDKGWYDGGERNDGEALMLIVTEVAEAMEDVRDGRMDLTISPSGKPEGFPVELADILIRVFDLAGSKRIDLDYIVGLKMLYNSTRGHRHGGKLA